MRDSSCRDIALEYETFFRFRENMKLQFSPVKGSGSSQFVADDDRRCVDEYLSYLPWSHEMMRTKAIASNGQIESLLPGLLGPLEPIFKVETFNFQVDSRACFSRQTADYALVLVSDLSFLFLHCLLKPGLVSRVFDANLEHPLRGIC
jgi:hypothetical protein